MFLLFSLTFVAQPGFEPRQTEPESVVLPLHNWAMPEFFGCKGTAFFLTNQIFRQKVLFK